MTFLNQESLRHAEPDSDPVVPARAPFPARLTVDAVAVVVCLLLAVAGGLVLDLWWASVLLSLVAVAGVLDFVLNIGPKRHRWRVLTTDLGTPET